ncbi:MAG: ATP-binding protein [Cyanobacteriota bacterium ELA615]
MFSRQSSFRGILLSRLLLVSLPILLIGIYVTYIKAYSAFLNSARYTLTGKAIRKADNIKESIYYLKSNLLGASSSYIFQEPIKPKSIYQEFINELTKELNRESVSDIYCFKLTQFSNNQIIANNCHSDIIFSQKNHWVSASKRKYNISLSNVHISTISLNQKYPNQLYLNFATPIYDSKGNIKFILNLVAAISESKNSQPISELDYSAIINEKGIILAYPDQRKIGNSIYFGNYEQRMAILLNNAIQGQKNFIHLISNEKKGKELIAGYSSIPSPITGEENKKWVILALSPLSNVIEPLKEIQATLFYMVFTLVVASVLAMLYMAYELASPIEQIRDYALSQNNLNSREELPKDVGIKEFDQLAVAIEDMLNRLQKWGEEIKSAWQEAKQANEVRNEFLTTISHELRTPLNGIINSIRVVKDGLCNNIEEEREFLEQAELGTIHLSKIINDILNIGKIEAGKMNVFFEPVDLQGSLTEVINLQKAAIQQKGLYLNEPCWESKVTVNADPDKLKQVFINLINNAIKFTDRGGINISFDIDEQNNSVIVKFQDTGIGIEPKDQSKLFRPFVMVDGSTTRKFGGTGLGLAICHNLMQLMGGKISLFSSGAMKGTTLVVTLPLLKVTPLELNHLDI